MKFNLGEPKLKVDLEALIDSRLLIQANSGGGKSWCIRRILEQTHGHVQQLVIDPEGEFGTLREKYDYVYAAKQGGDTAAHPRSAKLLAERLLELGVSAILDIYELKSHERVSFVRLFLESLVNADKKLWHPVLVVVDEAHVYCPQKGDAESAGAVNDLCTRGRKRGFCAVLATQRLSKLHKDAAAELNNKLIGRTGLDVDMNRAAEELGFTDREQRHSLRVLPKGHFYAFGPALVEGVTQVHVGPVLTRHPEAGARIAFTPAPPTAKVKALLPKLSDLPKEAEDRQRSEDKLKQEIATLRRSLTLAQRAQPTAAAPKATTKTVTIDRPVVTHAQLQWIKRAAKEFEKLATEIHGMKPTLVEKPGRNVTHTAVAVAGRTAGKQGAYSGRGVDGPPSPSPVTNGALPRGERKVLTAIAQYPDGVSRHQLTILTGYKRSTRDLYIQLLQRRDAVRPHGDLVMVTEAGVALLGERFEPLPVGSELLQHWRSRLPEGERRILDVLVEAYPESVGRDAVGEAAGYRRSTRDLYLQKLASRKLVEGRGDVRASELLFD